MNQSALILLGLLQNKPMHGYDIEAIIKESGMRHWAQIGTSTIFATLNRLADKGLLGIREEREGNRPIRKVFHLTRKGRDALKTEMKKGLSSSAPLYSSRITAAVFAARQTPETAGNLIDPTIIALKERRQMLREKEDQAEEKSEKVLLQYQRQLVDAEIKALRALYTDAKNTSVNEDKEADQLAFF